MNHTLYISDRNPLNSGLFIKTSNPYDVSDLLDPNGPSYRDNYHIWITPPEHDRTYFIFFLFLSTKNSITGFFQYVQTVLITFLNAQ